MRPPRDIGTLVLTLLLLPLLSGPAVDPGQQRSQPVQRLQSFPFPADRTPSSHDAARSVLLVPLDAGALSFKLTSADAGPTFDIDGDGDRDQVAWPEAGAEVAFLVRDVDGDGRIASGKEIFGSHMLSDARNGCNALMQAFRATGAPPSGAVHEGHALYEQLLLWVDRNQNGISEAREIQRAKDVFTAIGMGYSGVGWRDEHGNRVRYEGWAELRTGGPDQERAMDPDDHFRRVRNYYEVLLTIR